MITEKQSNQIKLTHYDNTKKRAHDSKIVKAKENFKHQAPTNGLKLFLNHYRC